MRALFLLAVCSPLPAVGGPPTIARIWNQQILSAIRIDRPNPPVHARNLFHLATVMYNAWAAYDDTAVGYIHHEKAVAADPVSARREAVSYAAYRLLRSRYAGGVNAAATLASLDNQLASLGYDATFTGTTGSSPAALGNRIAASVMTWSLADGCNESGSYRDATYYNPQPPMIVLRNGMPQGGIPWLTNPNAWQPLAFDAAFTQNGIVADLVQSYVGVTWLETQPFSLSRPDAAKPWLDPGGPSLLGGVSDAAYKNGALSVLQDSSRLNDPTIIDISPATLGQNPPGSDAGTGHDLNPVTGQPYPANLVARGDFARVLAEFWADGPSSETPPGHWHVLANEVTDAPGLVKRIGGTGPVVSDLEWEVKLYFSLAGATHNAACAAWALKRYYGGSRPITMIRYMAHKGQSSQPGSPSYHPGGLPLQEGVSEIITAKTAAPGGRHFLSETGTPVGAVGEIAVKSWPGEPTSPATAISPVRWMRAVDWIPYQRKTFNTPAFPGYVSGHSTFSRAAAAVLTSFTASPYFPGGLHTFTADAGTYLVFERGPSTTVQLQWATYADAADQAGQSRRWGGIHVPEDDYAGRVVGTQTGQSAWDLARLYWDGSILSAPMAPGLTHEGGSVVLRWLSQRGMFYQVQGSRTLQRWSDLTPPTAALDLAQSFLENNSSEQQYYRILRTLIP